MGLIKKGMPNPLLKHYIQGEKDATLDVYGTLNKKQAVGDEIELAN